MKQGSGLRVPGFQGSGFRAQDSGFQRPGMSISRGNPREMPAFGKEILAKCPVQGSGFRVQGSRAQDSGIRTQGLRLRVQGFRLLNLGFRIQGSGLRDSEAWTGHFASKCLRNAGILRANACEMPSPGRVITCSRFRASGLQGSGFQSSRFRVSGLLASGPKVVPGFPGSE